MIADAIIKYLNSIGYSWNATITPYGGTFYFKNDKETAKKVLNHLKELGYYDKLSGYDNGEKLMSQEHVPGELDGLDWNDTMYYIYWRN